MKLATRTLSTLLLAAALGGCTGDEPADEQADAAPAGHTITLRVQLVDQEGQLAFLTPHAKIATVDPGEVVGKPYYVGVFPAGFSTGNTKALHEVWRTVPADLDMTFTTPAPLPDGAYDIALVVFTHTPITDGIKNGTEPFPAAAGGDLATFTLSQADVREGDPVNATGTYRINLEGADVVKETFNRTPMDLMNGDEVAAAFNDTILLVP